MSVINLGEHLITEETVAHVQNLVRQHGTDCWWTLPIDQLLHPSYRNNGSSLFNSVLISLSLTIRVNCRTPLRKRHRYDGRVARQRCFLERCALFKVTLFPTAVDRFLVANCYLLHQRPSLSCWFIFGGIRPTPRVVSVLPHNFHGDNRQGPLQDSGDQWICVGRKM